MARKRKSEFYGMPWEPAWSVQFRFLETMKTRQVRVWLIDRRGGQREGYIHDFDRNSISFGGRKSDKPKTFCLKLDVALIYPIEEITLEECEAKSACEKPLEKPLRFDSLLPFSS